MRGALAGLAVALVLPLAACGGDSTDSYCRDLESHRKEIADMIGTGTASALLDGLPMLRELAEKSPTDLADEWQAYLGALEGLDDALKEAGVEAGDFKDGQAPDGLSAADQKSIVAAANQIATPEIVEASSGIEQQARDVCKVNLGL